MIDILGALNAFTSGATSASGSGLSDFVKRAEARMAQDAAKLDNSSGAMNVPEPFGDTYRGITSSWWNAENIAKEDWMRAEQSAQLAFQRESQFNASEAQKNRDFQSAEAEKAYLREREARQTAYQDTMKSMKEAGLNPVLAYQNGAQSVSSGSASGSQASASGSRSGYSGARNNDPINGIVSTIASLVAGLVTKSFTAGATVSEVTDIFTDRDGVVKGGHIRTFKHK